MLLGICGNLGSGKTCTLTFLGTYFYKRGHNIFANYHLKFKYTPINSLEDIDNVKQGIFLGDELWGWIDARASISEKNKQIAKILLRSRKRGVDIFYTAQHFKQMDVRVRRITDMLLFPELYPTGKCVIKFFNVFGDRVRRPIAYNANKIFNLYDTTEEVKEIEGFEGRKAVRMLKEIEALEKLKRMGIKVTND
jgi:hypothetical protein